MDSETFEAVKDALPVRYPAVYEALDSGRHFTQVKDPEAEAVIAVVRDVTMESLESHDSLVESLDSVRLLEQHGVKVAGRLPFSDGTRQLMLVDFIEGESLWKTDTGYTGLNPSQQENMLTHAKNLAGYYADCFQRKAPCLVDITRVFQYVLHGDSPVLVDLDLYMSDSDKVLFQPQYFAGVLRTIGVEYSNFLSEAQSADLAGFLEARLVAYAPGYSLFSPGSQDYDPKWEEWEF